LAKTIPLRERNKLRTRKEIHDAALQVFDEDGFSDSSIEKIANVAGISKGTIYAYFPSGIGDIYREIYVALSDELLTLAKDLRDREAAPVQRILALAKALLDMAAQPVQGRFYNLLSPMLSPVLAPVLGRASRAYVAMIAEDIAAMRPTGKAHPEDALVAELITGSMREAARTVSQSPGRRAPLFRALEILLRGLEAEVSS
jgi:AcrR family transcriptional regulator